MADAHKNFAYSTVATAPSPATSGTSLVVAAADGAKFPAVPFNATIWPTSAQPTTANAEIVRVTTISTDTLTITRAQENTSARTVVVGDQIAATVTVKTLTDAESDQQPSTYLTFQDETIPASTQVIFEGHLELASSFVYELATDAILIIGDFYTPAFPPGYEVGYAQITNSANVTDTTEAAATPLISSGPVMFDGSPVIAEFFCQNVATDTAAAGDTVTINLFEGLTQITRMGTVKTEVTTARNLATVCGRYRFSPTAGYHSYTITAFATSVSGTPSLQAGAGGTATAPPAYLRFTKV